MSNPNNPGYLQRIEEGQRIGNYYTWRYAGVDKSGNSLTVRPQRNIIPIAEGSEEDKCVTGKRPAEVHRKYDPQISPGATLTLQSHSPEQPDSTFSMCMTSISDFRE